MSKPIVFILLFFTIGHGALAQGVGLVLSGGGAKGLAHIGVIKALEESNIPIDYIAGTSMGGIVAGLYAGGMSPYQIEDIVTSKEFLRWVNGLPELGYNYYYSNKGTYPSFVRFNLSLDSTFNFIFNSSIASDLSLNFATAEHTALPSSVARNNFDSLFIPLRIVAADIFTQNEVILRDGVLGDAMRATQTVPFFYNPIKVNNMYLFDGGVYNNFPVDVMQKEFNPEVIIGVNVSTKIYDEYPYGEDEKLISKSLLFMLLDKSDPSSIPETGIYLQPNLDAYTALDFVRAASMIDSGYVLAMNQMDYIRSKVPMRRDREQVQAAREQFNSKAQPMIIQNVTFDGFKPNQQKYMSKFFLQGRRPCSVKDVKSGYFKLVSEEYFKNIYPSILYDTTTNQYNFNLAKRPQNNFQIDFGGVIATRSFSNIFLGLNYYYFNRALVHSSFNFFAGSFYKSAEIRHRIDMPNIGYGQIFIEPQATYNSWDFLDGKDIISNSFDPTVLNRIDRKVGASAGIPLGKHYKASLHGFYINNVDRYINDRVLVSADTLDRLNLSGIRTGINISTNTLDRKQYASRGRNFEFTGDWFSLRERFTPGSTSVETEFKKNSREWVRARLTLEQYFRSRSYSSGYYFDAVFSNQPLFNNFQGSLINAPAFNPIQDSKTLFLEKFRAFNFVAAGWRNVFSIRNNLDVRVEGYLFKPLKAIVEGQNQEGALDNEFTKLFFVGTAGLVFHSTVGPISLSANYYDDPQNKFGVLLHVGFLLFNKTSLE